MSGDAHAGSGHVPTRRDAIARLAALAAMSALPRGAWSQAGANPDPLAGTIAEYQAGRRRGAWSALEVTRDALERSRAVARH